MLVAHELVLLVASVRASLPVLSSLMASSIIHDHFGLQRLVDDVSLAAWSTSAANIAASSSLLPVATPCHAVLLVAACATSCTSSIALVRV